MRATVAKALAHPTRLRIIDLLLEKREACVCDIVESIDEGQSTISKHLAVLREAGILESRKEGLMVFYSLKTQCVQGFFACLDKVLRDDVKHRSTFVSLEVDL